MRFFPPVSDLFCTPKEHIWHAGLLHDYSFDWTRNFFYRSGRRGVDRCRFGVRSSQSIYGTSSHTKSVLTHTLCVRRFAGSLFRSKYLSSLPTFSSIKHQHTRTRSPTTIHHVQSYSLRTCYIRKARFRTTGSEQRASRPLQWPCQLLLLHDTFLSTDVCLLPRSRIITSRKNRKEDAVKRRKAFSSFCSSPYITGVECWKENKRVTKPLRLACSLRTRRIKNPSRFCVSKIMPLSVAHPAWRRVYLCINLLLNIVNNTWFLSYSTHLVS